LDGKTHDLSEISFFILVRGENLKKPLPRRVASYVKITIANIFLSCNLFVLTFPKLIQTHRGDRTRVRGDLGRRGVLGHSHKT